MAGKNFTYEDLQAAAAEADKDARLEMKIDYIVRKLEDPETGCTACRKEIKAVKARAEATDRKVDRIIIIGGTIFTGFTLFGKEVIGWIVGAAKGGP